MDPSSSSPSNLNGPREGEADSLAETAKLKAEWEAKWKAEWEAKLKAEWEAKLKSEYDVQLKAADAKVKAADAKVKAAEAKVEAAEAKVSEYDVQLKAADAKVEAAEAKVEAERKAFNQREAKLKSEYDVQLKAAEAKVKAAEAKVKAADTKVKAAEAKFRKAFNQREAKSKNKLKSEYDVQLKAADAKVKAAEAEVKAERKKKATLERKLKAAKKREVVLQLKSLVLPPAVRIHLRPCPSLPPTALDHLNAYQDVVRKLIGSGPRRRSRWTEKSLYVPFQQFLQKSVQSLTQGRTSKVGIFQHPGGTPGTKIPDIAICVAREDLNCAALSYTGSLPVKADVEMKRVLTASLLKKAIAQSLSVILVTQTSQVLLSQEMSSWPDKTFFILISDAEGLLFPFRVSFPGGHTILLELYHSATDGAKCILNQQEEEGEKEEGEEDEEQKDGKEAWLWKELEGISEEQQEEEEQEVRYFDLGRNNVAGFSQWLIDALQSDVQERRYTPANSRPSSFLEVSNDVEAPLLQITSEDYLHSPLSLSFLLLRPLPSTPLPTAAEASLGVFPTISAPHLSAPSSLSLEPAMASALLACESWLAEESPMWLGPLDRSLKQPLLLELMPTGSRQQHSFHGSALLNGNRTILVSLFFSDSALLSAQADVLRVSALLRQRSQLAPIVQTPCDWRVVGGFELVPSAHSPLLHDGQGASGAARTAVGYLQQVAGDLKTLTDVLCFYRSGLVRMLGDHVPSAEEWELDQKTEKERWEAEQEEEEDDDIDDEEDDEEEEESSLIHPLHVAQVLTALTQSLRLLHMSGLVYLAVSPSSLLFDFTDLTRPPVLSLWSSLSLASLATSQVAEPHRAPLNRWAQMFSAEQAWHLLLPTEPAAQVTSVRAMLADLESAVYTALFLVRRLPWLGLPSSEAARQAKRDFWTGPHVDLKPSPGEAPSVALSGLFSSINRLLLNLRGLFAEVQQGKAEVACSVAAKLGSGSIHEEWLEVLRQPEESLLT